jgi:putative flippase GtrA
MQPMTDATALLTVERSSADDRLPAVDIVIPVYNEEADLEASVKHLAAYLRDRFPLPWVITIADNASVDRTWGIACRLANEVEGVRAVHLERKGRGRALRAAWSASEAPVVAYMDVDLSTDLDALLPLVAPLLSGHSDVAIGSRLANGSRVVRGPKREAISRTYNLLLKATLRSGFSDAQCGFKAVRADVARALLPLVEDEGWFFDTELLVLAEENGLRIHEVPVDWVDDPGTTVDVVRTARDDLAGIWRMLRRSASGATLTPGTLRTPAAEDPSLVGQLVRFASIGAVSTVVFGALFWVLAGPLGAVGADAVALVVCALANTAANRRLTFALRGRVHRARHYTAGVALAALPFLLTLVALGGLTAAGVDGLLPRLVALTVVNGAATLGRFVALRRWVFGS